MGLDLGLGSSGESKLSACCGVWSGKCVPHNCVRAGAQSECAEAVVFGMRRRVVLAGCRSVGSGQRTQKQRQLSNHVQQRMPLIFERFSAAVARGPPFAFSSQVVGGKAVFPIPTHYARALALTTKSCRSPTGIRKTQCRVRDTLKIRCRAR